MKTSEDKLNEALRAALKRKFDNFEDVPNPSAFQKIRANLKPGPQWKYLFFTLIFVSVAIIGIVADQHFRKDDIAKKAVPLEAAEAADTKMNVAEMKSGTKTTAAKLALNSKNLTSRDIKPTAILDENTTARKATLHAFSENSKSSSSAVSNAEPESTFVNPQLSEKTQFSTLKKDVNSIPGERYDELLSNSPTSSVDDRALNFDMSKIDNQTVTLTSINPGKPDINVPETDIKPIVKHGNGNFNWLINAAVLQSYQILTVPSGAQSFQNFEFPSTFSLRSLGYKLSVGVEKKGFQFMLHFSRFQQSYSYEIAGNDYVVQTFDKDHFKVIRQGTRVSQDNNFRLIGVGVNKQVSWGNATVGKYYASAGLEYSYGMIRKQSIGWVNAGIGKQFPISRNSSLHIGPYAEFSPVKFSGSGDPFYYQPYRVGISAGLRLNK
ncbi:hypothetical protein [Dyadobacter psychrophilus]|uniref:Uncharacterized protein n=1 Tax=Dyadobacter psychrophilus TaxID=651661 RepID=A0A1T5ECR4_9BACT|nr:hypothetical protein [Dyadobacter psychrophilus]SKB81907.1 hypothetical protein SAMN05660293_02346 [Dyadobacter psychrophilus]